MKYIDNYSGEVISEDMIYEVANQSIEWSDLADYVEASRITISILQELQRLDSPLFESIWERVMEDYIENNFEEVEEDDE